MCVHWRVGMNVRVVQVPPHINQKNMNLFLRLSKPPRERRQSGCLKKTGCVLIIPSPELLEFLILGPAIRRLLEMGFNHVGESDLGYDLLELIGLFVGPA